MRAPVERPPGPENEELGRSCFSNFNFRLITAPKASSVARQLLSGKPQAHQMSASDIPRSEPSRVARIRAQLGPCVLLPVRLVSITENLAQWLEPHWKLAAPVRPPSSIYRRRFAAALKTAKIEHWPHNALRREMGIIPFLKIGGVIRFDRDQVIASLREHYEVRVKTREAR